MARELATIDFKVGSIRYRVKGAKWFYNDKDIRKKTGAELTSEADLKGEAETHKVAYQRKLVRMAMSIVRDTKAGSKAAQGDSKRRYFWCHPAKVYTAMKDLPGQKLDKSVFPGGYKIGVVEMPVDSNLA